MDKDLKRFIQQLSTTRQLSVHTVSNYQRDIDSFFDWYRKNGESMTIDQRCIQYFHWLYPSTKKSSRDDC